MDNHEELLQTYFDALSSAMIDKNFEACLTMASDTNIRILLKMNNHSHIVKKINIIVYIFLHEKNNLKISLSEAFHEALGDNDFDLLLEPLLFATRWLDSNDALMKFIDELLNSFKNKRPEKITKVFAQIVSVMIKTNIISEHFRLIQQTMTDFLLKNNILYIFSDVILNGYLDARTSITHFFESGFLIDELSVPYGPSGEALYQLYLSILRKICSWASKIRYSDTILYYDGGILNKNEVELARLEIMKHFNSYVDFRNVNIVGYYAGINNILIQSIEDDYDKIADYLIREIGADPNYRVELRGFLQKKYSILTYAAKEGRVGIVDCLIANKSYVNDGEAIHAAVSNNRVQIALKLIAAGANITPEISKFVVNHLTGDKNFWNCWILGKAQFKFASLKNFDPVPYQIALNELTKEINSHLITVLKNIIVEYL
ncbi:MAG: hypothetical protein Hyperionvirus4_81 [Hyperionvirus sp.]|uniref:Uncharacterized protein n=1 Tax=Hyperionvirus sp. TaxID=2487770 RepID=A0A3G5A792_9VIRU|nr:MAG: hypothetical protein Hyperionvirus4_81 [Hyperionvirus sp.]